ncbi:DUF1315 family protein [Thalassotalea sp. 1_MG-2023]|uniref:YeaC family protein n=1 Tax=Thalassotalea sp. 1_MG-2023 TaxID=3062680 RepID=UPI0026E30C9D|nr:DUF1315 family protein [Thalassotalea sp. 1_MG-2023]MDO6428594.1 DUF1315 family protein [Thalassotalea sp. 1_MG-2023]
MDILTAVESMPLEMYERLRYAAETGKWPEGNLVDDAQRESALQLSMAYQAKHLNSDEMLSVGADGQIVNKTKRQLKEAFTGQSPQEIKSCDKGELEIARFKAQ